MGVICKLRCQSKNLTPHTMNSGEKVVAASLTFSAVYDPDGKNPENRIFGDATPSAEFKTYIVNGKAHEYFVPGKDYYFRIEEAPAAQA
jgi:hypothetical protein